MILYYYYRKYRLFFLLRAAGIVAAVTVTNIKTRQNTREMLEMIDRGVENDLTDPVITNSVMIQNVYVLQ